MASSLSSTYVPTASDELPRGGSHNECYKWSTNHVDAFETWWKETQWFQTNQANRKSVPNWGSSKNAANWDHFEEGALRSTGEPKIICKRCDKVIAHTFRIGTSAMSSHIQTAGCMKVAKGKGLKQPTVVEGFKAGVRLPANYQELYTTNIIFTETTSQDGHCYV